VAGCCECGDEPSGSCATELVSYEVTSSAGFPGFGTIIICATFHCVG
jgi:hypothetical protein